jgi:hypothetical protein
VRGRFGKVKTISRTAPPFQHAMTPKKSVVLIALPASRSVLRPLWGA